MVVDGVEAGGGDPAPAEAVVGSALVALRDDLHKFMGWVVEVQGGTEDNQLAGEGHAVNVMLSGADGADQDVQCVLVCIVVCRRECGLGCGRLTAVAPRSALHW